MPTFFDRLNDWIEKFQQKITAGRLSDVARAVKFRVSDISEYTNGEINKASIIIQRRLKEHPEDTSNLIIEALALASLAVKRFIDFYPNETQIIAALLLTEGRVVELRAGEGKTIVAILAAYWEALQGHHVDIATTNDYLALRDYRWTGLVYGTLGIPTGVVTSTTERGLRKSAYQKHVTYVAHQELAFDYLRDHMTLTPEDRVSGPLDFIILDEVDSILIDEARTSFIISQPCKDVDVGSAKKKYQNMRQLIALIRTLKIGEDYTVDYRKHSVTLTDIGTAKISSLFKKEGSVWHDPEFFHALWYALYASVFFQENKEYVVENNKVILIDEFTGHALPDRVLLKGLQQAVEAKSDIPPSREFDIVASITYRNFFKLYKKISGMTGTAYDARWDFRSLYNLETFRLSPHKKPQRRDLPTIFFRTEQEKNNQAVIYAKNNREKGIPLLIVTRSIEAAVRFSQMLNNSAIPHQLLHAAVGEKETDIIESAGKPGTITVATNMAGRGADIILDNSLRYSYGLHVLGLEHNLSKRVDEQLRGRAGRQGQFGLTQFFASLEDELFQVYADDDFWDRAEKLAWPDGGIIDTKLQAGIARAQEEAERIAAESRLILVRFDSVIDLHRKAIYAFRQAILDSPSWIDVVLKEIQKILGNEEHSRISKVELDSFLNQERVAEKSRKLITSLIFSKSAPHGIALLQINVSGDTRKKFLQIIDSHWREYLANIDYLQDNIAFISLSGENPYEIFIKDADRIFHEIRRDLAFGLLRGIIDIMTSSQTP